MDATKHEAPSLAPQSSLELWPYEPTILETPHSKRSSNGSGPSSARMALSISPTVVGTGVSAANGKNIAITVPTSA